METLSDWAGMDGHIPIKKKPRRSAETRMMREQQEKEINNMAQATLLFLNDNGPSEQKNQIIKSMFKEKGIRIKLKEHAEP